MGHTPEEVSNQGIAPESRVQHSESLQRSLGKCVTQKTTSLREASVAATAEGNEYEAGYVSSDTHLLHIPPEQVALMLATQYEDYGVNEIMTMREGVDEEGQVLPFTAQILIDYARRSGETLAYSIVDTDGATLFDTDDVYKLQPYYQPKVKMLAKVQEAVTRSNVAPYDTSTNLKTALHKYAVQGLEKGFPTSDTGGRYGTAVVTDKNNIYYAGQYSSFEHRSNIHSEMAAVLSALMHGDTHITHVGLVSNKYPDSPSQMCGCCRQFLSEISTQFDLSPELNCFALETGEVATYTLEEYLPDKWSNKK